MARSSLFGQNIKVLLFGLALHFRFLPIDGAVLVVWSSTLHAEDYAAFMLLTPFRG
jgi:hypothetical protein